MWTNIGLQRFKTASVEGFTSRAGMRVRRFIRPAFQLALRLTMKRRVFVEAYPALEKGVPYIFAATHAFVDEVAADLAYVDRSAYLLMGTTDQLEHNPQAYATWLNGMIFVDKDDPQSRRDAVGKMERVLNGGTSVFLYPEGGWNNTENLLCQPLFAGVYHAAAATKRMVVPVANYNEHGSNDIHLAFGAPLALAAMEKREALTLLRDAMATMLYNMMEAYGTPAKRADLPADPRQAFMEERKREYLQTKWTRDVWEEEISFYHDKTLPPTPQQVRASFDKVRLTPQNAALMAPILLERERDKRYDFLAYMRENWDK